MKGFIEVTEKGSGITLINTSHILIVCPSGKEDYQCDIYLNATQRVIINAMEPYDVVKKMIEESI